MQPNRIEPEIGILVITLNMHVGWLLAIACAKEEAIRADASDRRHFLIMHRLGDASRPEQPIRNTTAEIDSISSR